MKRRMILRQFRHRCALAALLVCMSARALAYDGAAAWRWMEQFAQALEAFVPLNDAEQTSDPARAGQYLIEYEFGTVLASVPETPVAQEILEIDVRTGQVTDCREFSAASPAEDVGMEDVGAGDAARSMAQPPSSSATQKYRLRNSVHFLTVNASFCRYRRKRRRFGSRSRKIFHPADSPFNGICWFSAVKSIGIYRSFSSISLAGQYPQDSTIFPPATLKFSSASSRTVRNKAGQ